MKKIIVIAFLFFYSFIAFGQHSFTLHLKSVCQITFPDTPKKEIISGNTIYLYKDINNNIYLAQCSPIDKSIPDLFNKNILDTVYDGYISGVVGSVKGRVFYKKKINEFGLKGIEFGYRADIKDNIYYTYQQAFYFNEILVSYAYWSTDSLQRNDEKINAYFNTFKLDANGHNIRQSNELDLAAKAGHITGFILFIAIIGSIGFFIVFIINRLFNK